MKPVTTNWKQKYMRMKQAYKILRETIELIEQDASYICDALAEADKCLKKHK